jgi:hypothetical protein
MNWAWRRRIRKDQPGVEPTSDPVIEVDVLDKPHPPVVLTVVELTTVEPIMTIAIIGAG